jgi:[amino group carrier protein]-L-2-aminoadipate 6-kinase
MSDVLVVKLGGAAGIDPQPLLDELATLQRPWVLVHGGNAELDEVSRRLGHEPRFVTSPSGHSSRVTDEETIRLMQMVYRGRINNELVLGLQRRGINAIGLSGVDGGILRAQRKEAIKVVENGRRFMLRNDFTGRITDVDASFLRLLLASGRRPVLTPPALADDGTAVNVDGDRAAAMVARALGASELIILSNVAGLLRDPADPTTRIAHIPRDQLDRFESFAQGRFRKKLLGVQEALAGGVGRIALASANTPHPIADAWEHGTVIA